MSRIAIITNVLSHYRFKCFDKMHGISADEMTFYFLVSEMSHRGYVMASKAPPFPSIWLKGWNWHRPPNDDKHLNNISPIIKGDYDVIIMGGWDEPTYLLLWIWGLFFRKKIIFWIESTAYEGVRKGIKEQYKKLLLKYAAGCIVPGKRSFEYCRMLGMSEDRIFIAPNAADREYFRDKADELLPLREEIRKEMGLEGTVFLFVGRLVEEYKGVSDLVSAFRMLSGACGHKMLLVVGDGPDRQKYEQAIAELHMEGVRFFGRLDHEAICRIYAASDIFILPSKLEPWGFVLNEAMEFGLPLIVSEIVGAGPDLVHEGVNGFVFPAGNVNALADKLEILIKDELLRNKMGEASRKIIEDFSPENWAKGVKNAIESVCKKIKR